VQLRSKAYIALLTLLLFGPALASPQPPADADRVRRVALDYIEGWYAGDADRMARAVHPALVKRIVRTRDGKSTLHEMGAAELIAATARQTPPQRRRSDVRILDIFGNTASVRIDADEWIDYPHLARIDGKWRIVNVLWALRSGNDEERAPGTKGS
jgi:hypothetical protein